MLSELGTKVQALQVEQAKLRDRVQEGQPRPDLTNDTMRTTDGPTQSNPKQTDQQEEQPDREGDQNREPEPEGDEGWNVVRGRKPRREQESGEGTSGGQVGTIAKGPTGAVEGGGPIGQGGPGRREGVNRGPPTGMNRKEPTGVWTNTRPGNGGWTARGPTGPVGWNGGVARGLTGPMGGNGWGDRRETTRVWTNKARKTGTEQTRTNPEQEYHGEQRARTREQNRGEQGQEQGREGGDQRRGVQPRERDQPTKYWRERPRAETNNQPFAHLVKTTYRHCQVRHHQIIWAQLPRKISKYIDDTFDLITPPYPDNTLEDELKDLEEKLKKDIQRTIELHLQRAEVRVHGDLTSMDLTDMDPNDKGKALEIAYRQLTSRHGHKMNHETRVRYLGEADQLLGTWTQRGEQRSGEVGQTGKGGGGVEGGPKETEMEQGLGQMGQSDKDKGLGQEEGTDTDRGQTTGQTEADMEPGEVNRKRLRIEGSPQTSCKNGNSRMERETGMNKRKKGIDTDKQDGGEEDKRDSAGDGNGGDVENVGEVGTGGDEEQTGGERERENIGADSDKKTERKGQTNRTIRTRGLSITHLQENKDKWRIVPGEDTRSIIFGDSNLKLMRDCPPEVETHAFPGMQWKHVSHVLNGLGEGGFGGKVLIAVGINHRNMEYSENLDALNHFQEQVKGKRLAFEALFVAGTPTNGHLDACQARTIVHLNSLLQKMIGKDGGFVPPLTDGDIVIAAGDKFNIHHTQETVDKNRDHYLNFLARTEALTTGT
jgi:hypothetical protein